jgi:hypothetical protein
MKSKLLLLELVNVKATSVVPDSQQSPAQVRNSREYDADQSRCSHQDDMTDGFWAVIPSPRVRIPPLHQQAPDGEMQPTSPSRVSLVPEELPASHIVALHQLREYTSQWDGGLDKTPVPPGELRSTLNRENPEAWGDDDAHIHLQRPDQSLETPPPIRTGDSLETQPALFIPNRFVAVSGSGTNTPGRHKRKMGSHIAKTEKQSKVLKVTKQRTVASEPAIQVVSQDLHARQLSQPLSQPKRILFDGVEVLPYRALLTRHRPRSASPEVQDPATGKSLEGSSSVRAKAGRDDWGRSFALTDTVIMTEKCPDNSIVPETDTEDILLPQNKSVRSARRTGYVSGSYISCIFFSEMSEDVAPGINRPPSRTVKAGQIPRAVADGPCAMPTHPTITTPPIKNDIGKIRCSPTSVRCGHE